MKKLIIQFFKFGIVGAINTINSWIIYYILLFFNVQYLIANTVSYFCSTLIGYLLNKVWVFKKNENSDKKDKTSLIKYYVVYISSYFLNMVCMYFFVDILNVSDKIAPILVLFVTVPYNFVFSRLWVFTEKKKKKEPINKENLQKMAKKLHTFAICAYKDATYLEEAVKSVLNQTIQSNYVIITSTDNEHIRDIAKRYDIKYVVRKDKSDIQDDWNFACKNARTELVTVTHQDDIYEPDYLENILLNYDSEANMYIVDYNPYKNGKVSDDRNCKIKERLKFFLRSKKLCGMKFFKVSSIAFGNSINCPGVTYNKKRIKGKIFTSNLKFALDWDTFLKISKINGKNLYIHKRLINYRIHDGATTKEFIVNNKRKAEDIEMFNKFWPNWITKILIKFYVKCYDVY